jgi:hypothetical protein
MSEHGAQPSAAIVLRRAAQGAAREECQHAPFSYCAIPDVASELVAGFAPAEESRPPEVLLWSSTLRLCSAFVDANRKESHIARRAHQRRAQREAFLRAQLEPEEMVVAHHGAVMVTERRVLFAWDLYRVPDGPSWFGDAIPFEEVARWSLGRRHDERPLLHLEHPTHVRTERVPAHTLLWFHWGNAEAEVLHDDVTLAFAGKRDEAFRATLNRLQYMNIPRGGDFLVALPGTREERTRSSRAYSRRLWPPPRMSLRDGNDIGGRGRG